MSSTLATQFPIGSETADSDLDVHFHAIDDAEPLYRYGPGGYHPVSIGNRLGGHYRILNELGHGTYSTVWLARDETAAARCRQGLHAGREPA